MALSGALHRLIYVSSAIGVLRADELDRILLRAKASNAGAGITGLLLFHEGTFLQVIEGSPAGVLSLMERIRRDRRHRGLALLESHVSTTRAFPDSPMAYVAPRNLTPGQRQELGELLTAVRRREALGGGESLSNQLWSVLSSFQAAEAA
jgi:hypothetical protein